MNDSSGLPNKVVETMVEAILRKNGVKKEELKKNISEEQKQILRDMVEDLRKQVEEFNNKKNTTADSSE